jgi:predicted  nucleic acid-binding Zn-ribbon protein
MEHNLGEVHDARRQELEQVQVAVALESSRLQEEISDLERRMAKLDESARRLESGLDKRLSQLSSDTMRSARSQLDNALEVVLSELGTRNVQALRNQLAEASANLQTIQKGIEASVSESLRVQVAETLQSFQHRLEELAQQSVERWHLALASTLNSLATTLGEQFRSQAATDDSASQHSSVE